MKKIKAFSVVLGLAIVMTFVGFTPIVSEAANTTTNSTSDNSKKESSSSKESKATIPNGVKINGEDMSGKTEEEATKALASQMKKYSGVTYKLKVADKSIDASATDLGLKAKNDDVATKAINYGTQGDPLGRYKASKDIESGKGKDFKISYTTNTATTSKYLESKSAYINTKTKDNGLSLQNGKFTYAPGTAGTTVDVAQSAAKIADYVCANWNGQNGEIDLVYTTTEPKGSQEELASVKDAIGTFTTDFSSSAAGRAQNVKNGCSKINGTILYPGDTFSVYETVSPFEPENGYELAGAYENGTTVESYGGGICQVSTTLYNAVINAELEIVQRSNHTMIVGYVPPSQDAAIAGTYMDFKFKNNQQTPIYIDGYTGGGKITFTIYGKETRPSNRKIKFESEVIEETEPGISFKYSGDMPAGSIKKESDAHVGKKAKLWKIVTVDGVEQSKTQFNSSVYKPGDKIFVIGSAGLSPEGKAAIDAAIASKDEGAVKAAVAAAASGDAGAIQAAHEAANQAAAAAQEAPPAEPAPEAAPV